jgi:hypothetical protein
VTNEAYRNLAGGLAAVLAVLVVASGIVFLSGPPAASRSPGSTFPSPTFASPTFASPTVSPSVSPSARPSPTESLPTSPAVTPTPTPAATPTPPPTEPPTPVPTEPATPTPAPPATPAPTPPPTLGPTADLTEIRFGHLGLDGPGGEQAPAPRYFLFRSDGPGDVTASVSGVTAGRVELCLWVGDRDDVRRRECRVLRDGSLTATTNRPAQTSWVVSVVGADAGVTPSANVAIAFRAVSPTITAEDLRFQGTASPDHNGFDAIIRPRGPGTLALDARWTGGTFPYRVRLEPPDGAPADEQTGSGTNVTYTRPVVTGRHRLLLENQEDAVEVESFVRAVFAWP